MPTDRPDPLSLLDPGALLGGPLFRSLAASTLPPRLPAGTRMGPFRIESELGYGGMGVVYRAHRDDGQFEQVVAIKCIARPGAARATELFQRERQVLASLRHPHIARLLDGGQQDDGGLWFAMELIEGVALDAHASAAQLDVPARLRLLLQVVDAVAFAHARLLLHRDLKPSNVLVDADGSVKLLDFGVSSLAGDPDAARAYSPGWASPEQRAGEPIGPASDQYQLALLLDALLRLHAHPGEGPRKVEPRAWQLPAGLRRDELAAIAVRATGDDPVMRYGSVREFGDELLRWLERRPVRAYGSGLGYTLRRAISRHPWASASSSAGFLLLVALVAGFSWRLAQERDAAREAAERAEAINRFLNEDLLAQADPYNSTRIDLSMREALDRARLAVGSRFATRPELESTIRATLSEAYAGVDQLDIAREELDRAIALLAAQPEPDTSALLTMRLDRAEIDALARDFDAALPAFESLREEVLERHGPRSPLAVEVELKVLIALNSRGPDGGVAARADALLATLDAHNDPDGSARLRALLLLGDAKARLGRLDEARERIGEAMAIIGGNPNEAQRRKNALQSLAFIERNAGKLERAIELQREVVTECERRFGRMHPETLTALNELASILQDADRLAEAEPLFREVLALREQRLGIGNPLTRNSLNNLGLLLSLQDRLDEAEVLYRRALDAERAALGNDALDVLILAHNLAGLLRKRGDSKAALDLHTDTVERAQRTLGETRVEPSLFRVGLAQTLQKLERWDEADAELMRARQQLAAVYGDDNPRVLKVDQMRDALRTAREAAGD